MSSWKRITLGGVSMHIIQRGNNRQACFFADEDYLAYLQWLGEYAKEGGGALHAYVLMTNHVHLLLTPRRADSAGELIKRLGQRYVQQVNRGYQRSGTLWEGRIRSCLAQADDYLLSCYRYIELNPVRARIVAHPADYPWSSYRANAQGEKNKLLKAHAGYTALGKHLEQRRAAYRELFRDALDPGVIDALRRATNGNYALGSARFVAQIEAAVGRRATPGKSGRPRKDAA